MRKAILLVFLGFLFLSTVSPVAAQTDPVAELLDYPKWYSHMRALHEELEELARVRRQVLTWSAVLGVGGLGLAYLGHVQRSAELGVTGSFCLMAGVVGAAAIYRVVLLFQLPRIRYLETEILLWRNAGAMRLWTYP